MAAGRRAWLPRGHRSLPWMGADSISAAKIRPHRDRLRPSQVKSCKDKSSQVKSKSKSSRCRNCSDEYADVKNRYFYLPRENRCLNAFPICYVTQSVFSRSGGPFAAMQLQMKIASHSRLRTCLIDLCPVQTRLQTRLQSESRCATAAVCTTGLEGAREESSEGPRLGSAGGSPIRVGRASAV